MHHVGRARVCLFDHQKEKETLLAFSNPANCDKAGIEWHRIPFPSFPVIISLLVQAFPNVLDVSQRQPIRGGGGGEARNDGANFFLSITRNSTSKIAKSCCFRFIARFSSLLLVALLLWGCLLLPNGSKAHFQNLQRPPGPKIVASRLQSSSPSHRSPTPKLGRT